MVALVLVSVAPPRLGLVSSQGSWTGAGAWTNGEIAATFVPNRPALTVASTTSEDGYGLYAGVAGLTEYAPNGTAVASSDFTTLNWNVANGSSANRLVLVYSTAAPVTRTSAAALLGAVSVSVNFTGVAGSAAGAPASYIEFGMTVAHWPWVSASDILGVQMPLWPNSNALERLATPSGVDQVNCESNDSATPSEYFSWEPTANASWGSSAPRSLEASPTVLGGPSYATVTVQFGGSPGGYGTLQYDPRVGIFGASTALPVLDYAAIGIGLAGLAVAVVAVQRRAWSRAPGLSSAEER